MVVPYNSPARVSWCGSDAHPCRSADRCSVEGGDGGNTTSGSFSVGVPPGASTKITLTCTNADRSLSPSDSVTLVAGLPGGGTPQCADGKDNDGDGKIDGGLDTNGDKVIDIPADPGCLDSSGKYNPGDNGESTFNIKEIIPDFFNLNWFKLNFANFFTSRALGNQ